MNVSDGDGQHGEGHYNETPLSYTNSDFRFTTNDNILYAICLGKPIEKLLIKSLAAETELTVEDNQKIELLGTKGELAFQRDFDDVRATIPNSIFGEHA